MDLTEIRTKSVVVVKEVLGGTGAEQRLEALGIRRGTRIRKISSHFWKGPVTVRIESTKSKVAIGHGMARKMIVEES